MYNRFFSKKHFFDNPVNRVEPLGENCPSPQNQFHSTFSIQLFVRVSFVNVRDFSDIATAI